MVVYRERGLLYVEHTSNITKLTIWASKRFKHITVRTVAFNDVMKLIYVLFKVSLSSSLHVTPLLIYRVIVQS